MDQRITIQRLGALASALCLALLLASGCGGGDAGAEATGGATGGSGATGGMMQNADGMNCMPQMDSTNQMQPGCCSQLGEVPILSKPCSRHEGVAVGCMLNNVCTFYATGGAIESTCKVGDSCEDCIRNWNSGVETWCGS